MLLDVDMWDRWGSRHASDEEKASYAARADAARGDRTSAAQDLDALVARLRVEAPEAIVAWADAHDAFLAAFIATCADAAPGSRASTGRFVAEQERAAWAEVRSGARAWVEENVYYIPIDPDRYRAVFGIDP